MIGTIDASFVVIVSALAIYAWRSGNAGRTGLILAWFCPAAASAVAILKGGETVLWMYPSFVGPFFLVNPWMAVVVNILAAAAVLLFSDALVDPSMRASFVATGAVVSLFAFIFAYRSDALRRELTRLAAHDALTGVRNRRALEETLQRVVESHRRNDVEHGLIMLDLDNFKHVNDEHGHEAGDGVLVDLATLINTGMRQPDQVFRYGGEEFVMLLLNTGAKGAAAAAEKLRERIASELYSPGRPVTASFGVAVLRAGEGWEHCLGRADAALYRAKKRGRNCVVVDQIQPG